MVEGGLGMVEGGRGMEEGGLGAVQGTWLCSIAGNVPEGSGGFEWLCACGGVEVGLERGEDGDEQVNVIDSETHLEGGR